jgi:hypothetical protein
MLLFNGASSLITTNLFIPVIKVREATQLMVDCRMFVTPIKFNELIIANQRGKIISKDQAFSF